MPLPPDMKAGINQLVPTTLQLNLLHGEQAIVVSSTNQTVTHVTNTIPVHKLVSKQRTKNHLAVQVLRSIYGLKQSGRIWYHRFRAEMLAIGFVNNEIALCLFIKHMENIITAIYVGDISIFGNPHLTASTISTLKAIFQMKDIGKPTYCFGIQIEILPRGIFIHQ